MKKYISSGLALGVILALSACDSSTSTADSGTAYYVDSAVEGISYQCGSQSGTTDASGMFKFSVDSDCTFKLGNILLKTISSDQLIDNATIVENNLTVATFLQTVDVDGNASNGIEITPSIAEALATDSTTSIPKDSTELDAVFNILSNNPDYKGRVVSEAEAEEHLKITQASVTTAMLAGKTLYVVHISNEEHSVGEVSFNQDMTETTRSGIINDTDTTTETIQLEGNKIIWPSDDSYTIVDGAYTDYILAFDYNADGSADATSYIFYNQSDAEAFYNAKYPAS
jgi:hypothetical protein